MRPEVIPCPACGAAAGDWCRRHGATQPGALLCCVARVRAAAKVEPCGPHTVCVVEPCARCAAPDEARPCPVCDSAPGVYWSHAATRGGSDRLLCGPCWSEWASGGQA